MIKKYEINCQLQTELIFIIILHSSLLKAVVNAPRLCKLFKDCLTEIGHGAMGVNKTPPFLNFPFLHFLIASGTGTIAHLPIAEGLSLDRCFQDCKLRNGIKDLIQVRSEFHYGHLNWLPN